MDFKAAGAEKMLHFNGLNGASGEYGMPAISGEQLSELLSGQAEPDNLEELRQKQGKGEAHYGVKADVDPTDLAQAGWGVIFAQDADPAMKEALGDLINLRKEQAGEHFKIYEGEEGLHQGEKKNKFLARHGIGPGPADPDVVPYYLLLVGSPDAIPYTFQYQLDVQYAVGRIHFETPDDYANYARSVVAAEKGQVKRPKELAFFSAANPGDMATNLAAEFLIKPLREKMEKTQQDWSVSSFIAEEATKEKLVQLAGGDQTPALLFTASHGVEFPQDDSRQVPHQGGLVCQDWPGPEAWHEPLPQDFYLAGDDLTSDCNVGGLFTFMYACYGAGTPQFDEFSRQAFKKREAIAPHPFVAGLPTRMLAHPRGGALATIGHMERTWGYSFLWPEVGSQTTVFESTLTDLLKGYPVGLAMEYFDQRYAELSSDLTTLLDDMEFGEIVDPAELAGAWTANNDARSYMVLGDPAVRMMVGDGAEGDKREVLLLSSDSQADSTDQPAPAAEEPQKEAAGEAPSPEVSFAIKAPAEGQGDLDQRLQQLCEEGGRLVAQAEEALGQGPRAQPIGSCLEAIKAMLKVLEGLSTSDG